ncbi:angiopoietin-related protein 7-like [Drosophila takahashii]|uniref:angiopoietin-related protein 7-like n=1 Tax=Drosophila takahashii TaxID=29030 RepID=UPI00389943D0
MRKDMLNMASNEQSGSLATDASSHSSDSDIESINETNNTNETVYELKKKLADSKKNQSSLEEKILLYKDSLKDKNDLIKSLNITIDLMKQNHIFQNEGESRKEMKTGSDHATKLNQAERSSNLINNEDLQTLQTKFEECQLQNATLSERILNLETKLMEKENDLAESTEKYKLEEGKLKSRIIELESNAKIDAANLKEKDDRLAKYTINLDSCDNSNLPKVILNHSKVPNIRCIETEGLKHPFSAVFENITTAGPDWMIILRRFDGSESFHFNCLREFGFGNLSGEYFIGFEVLHHLTKNRRHELYVELEDFDNVKAYARYDNFVVGSNSEGYAIKTLGSYSGNAGDALRNHVEHKVTNQQFLYAQKHKHTVSHENRFLNRVQWWWPDYETRQCCLTGRYENSKTSLCRSDGIWWGRWNPGQEGSALKACKMLIRPKL